MVPRKIPVSPVEDLPAGEARIAALSGGREIAVFNVDGAYHAVDNRCPHQGAPLAKGQVVGDHVVCPLHRLQFDLRDGRCPWSAVLSVRRYPVVVERGWVFVEV